MWTMIQVGMAEPYPDSITIMPIISPLCLASVSYAYMYCPSMYVCVYVVYAWRLCMHVCVLSGEKKRLDLDLDLWQGTYC